MGKKANYGSIQQDLMLNIIPLHFKPGSRKFSFFKERPQEGEFVSLEGHHIPRRLAGYERLYTDFRQHSKADLSVKIPISENRNFACHYLKHLLYSWFEGKADIRNRNFIRDVELYFKKDKTGVPGFEEHHRFTIKAYHQKFSDGFEVGMMYSGTMKVWNQSVLNYSGHSEDITKVVYEGQLYRYADFRELKPNANFEKAYPVLNRSMAKELNLPPQGWKQINKVKQHTQYIHRFYQTWIDSDDFISEFQPDEQGFMHLGEEDIHQIDPAKSLLQFGNQHTNYDPMQGLKKAGPYHIPPATHLDLFIIVPEADSSAEGNELYQALKNGKKPFPGLGKFAKFPVNNSEHHITFKNINDPLPEIRQKLSHMKFDPSKNYAAIYISPFEKDHPDPDTHRIYYRVKELLLKHRITSQVITKSSVSDPSFGYYLPNIATALIAKLGGIPWSLAQKDQSELIIGIGAYRPKKLEKTYLGSAFCFLNDGTFKGFDSFTKNDMVKLGGSFQKAIRKYREQHPDVERVVLHFYKRISRKESRILRDALREMKLDIPMVIMTIYKTGSKDLVIADVKQPHRLPVSGTWYQSGRNQFLLCINTRVPGSNLKIKSHPFPLKMYIDIVASGEEHIDPNLLLKDQEWIQELLTQVYQFSRLNWQTVSLKEIPVSIAYPEMVAEKFPFFEGNKIPDFGKENFWFL